jgi:hypothetical protein
MKKTLFALIAGVIILCAGCKKKEDDDAAPSGGGNPAPQEVSPVPATFTQKVLLEEFTGTWCGYCPDGALRMEDIMTNNPGKAIGASIHDSDPMTIALNSYMNTTFDVNGWPSAMINRIPKSGDPKAPMNRGYWASQTTLRLMDVAKCGLAMTSSVGTDSITVTVHAGFNEALTTGTYKLVVYVTENDVHGTGGTWPQHNYDNTTAGSPLFGLGDPITGAWYHQHVVRKILTANAGDAIAASALVAGGEHVQTFKFAPGTWDVSKMHIVAFVAKIGTSLTTHQVLNVQEVAAGGFKNWD